MAELTEEQVKEIYDAFKLFDVDHTGNITAVEMGNVMRSIGQLPTEAELYDLIDTVDLDGDGEVDFQEFLHMMAMRFQNLYDDNILMEAFKVFDRDEDGVITQPDLKIVMTNLGEKFTEQEFQDMFREVDTDNNGVITFEEFLDAVKH
ncbi:neo-calmodulin [Drosophila willistoni]|uniref:GK21975 n=1 Tax=Drosophila willistoni TaxID=7260 RepID=B4MR09_DROWI|nr:neo-calmodulin [Drosophila willistoni]